MGMIIRDKKHQGEDKKWGRRRKNEKNDKSKGK